MRKWWKGNVEERKVRNELNPIELMNEAVRLNKGHKTIQGGLSVSSGHHTGRSADDKYVVVDTYSESIIDWENKINKLNQETYLRVKNEILEAFSEVDDIYTMERLACAHSQYSLGIRLISTNPVHALFVHNMFSETDSIPKLGSYTIFHHPEADIGLFGLGLKSNTAIIINFSAKEIIIVGTSYAGEIKKAVFSVLNTLLPDLGVLPMHAGACVTESGESSVFFGLSGTGKTTLSTDKGCSLIGDDELGLTIEGLFNFENGCYAKTLNLSRQNEPEIYKAVMSPGTILENVTVDINTLQPVFSDSSLTENGRASYPLTSLQNVYWNLRKAPLPKNIFFLSADAFGVLPPVSKLTVEQAAYYFLSGYSAKLAQTEMGTKEVKATFSHCFGAPFMMRKPQIYLELLMKYMLENKTNVWLINTGWHGGAYGIGKRYELKLTRNIIRSIQRGELDQVYCITEPYFGLCIPEEVPQVPEDQLFPYQSWSSTAAYEEQCSRLKDAFKQNLKKLLPDSDAKTDINHLLAVLKSEEKDLDTVTMNHN